MRLFQWLLIVAGLGTSQLGAAQSAPAHGSESAAVYAAVLHGFRAQWRNGPIEVASAIRYGSDPLTTRLLSGAAPSEFRPAVEALLRAAPPPEDLPPDLQLPPTMHLVPGSALLARPETPGQVVVVTLSPVGFSADSTRAAVYLIMDCGNNCAGGQLVLLRRAADGSWQPAARQDLWQS